MDDELPALVEFQGGILLAHTALLTSLIGTLKGKGILSADQVHEIMDFALMGVEIEPSEATPGERESARRLLENMAADFVWESDKLAGS